MFWHSFKYAFRSLLRNRALMFWTLAFPFILAILFNLAFARLHDYDQFEALEVAVIDDADFSDEQQFKEAFKSLSEGDEHLLNIRYIDKDEAEALLSDEEIEGYVYFVEDEPRVKIKENGVNQTVLVTVVEQISQSLKIAEDIVAQKLSESPEAYMNIEQIYKDAAETIANAKPNIKDDSRVMNMVTIEFYTLIAMACMQGAMLSMELTDRNLPNVTNRGKRVAVAPTHKSVIVASNLLAGYIVLLASVLGLIAFMRFVLGVEFGSDLRLICALAATGALTATMLGLFLSIVLKVGAGAKNVIVLSVTMIGSLFAGMFGGHKNYFDNLAPFINKISPVGLITDGYYSLYYYDDLKRFWVNLGTLLAISAVLYVLSIRGLRRQRYDSI